MADLLTEIEAADIIRRPKETLRYWRWQGEGPPWFKLGRRVVYDRAEFEAWIEAQKRSSGSNEARR
ncbi:MAG: helix-turn-helix domain-containing protein [Mycobacterium sp.]